MLNKIVRFIGNTINLLAASALVFSFAVVTLFSFWIFVDNRTPPSKFDMIDFTKTVEPGGNFWVEWEIHRNRLCRVEINRYIENLQTHDVHILYTGIRTPEQVGINKVFVHTELPKIIAPGIYAYKTELQYYCNPANNLFGPIRYSPNSLAFRVK